MSNSNGAAISIMFIAVMIALITIEFDIQANTQAVNNANPSYVSQSIQSSISESIASVSSASSLSAYCNSLSTQTSNVNDSIQYALASQCPGSVPSLIPTFLLISILATATVWIAVKFRDMW